MEGRDDAFLQFAARKAVAGIDDRAADIVFCRFDHDGGASIGGNNATTDSLKRYRTTKTIYYHQEEIFVQAALFVPAWHAGRRDGPDGHSFAVASHIVSRAIVVLSRKTAEAVTTTGARAQVCASLFRPTADTAFAWPPEISGETAGKISQ
jgi:hypothetical protein